MDSRTLSIAATISLLAVTAGADELCIREIKSFTSPEKKPNPTEPLFRSIPPAESGLDFVIPIDTNHPDKRLYYSAMACGSIAAGDLDGDGLPELFFAAGPVPNRLFGNQSNEAALRFIDVTDQSGLGDPDSWSTGAAMVDIDDDGDLDLYVCRYDQPNRLFINESTPGVFSFKEAAAEWGLDIIDATLMPAFADYDNDGDLDLFLAANAYYRKGGRPRDGIPTRKTATGWEIVPPWDRFYAISSIDPESGQMKYDETGRPNRLLRRDEGNHYTDVSSEAGILQNNSHTNAAVWWDYDGDGRLDLYVANDFADRDELYRNLGNGSFAEVAADVLQHTTWFSMGAAAEDLNGDGRTDLVVADMLPSTHYRQKVTMGEMGDSFDAMYAAGLPLQTMVNTCFINTGTGFFFEASRMHGIANTDWTWTVKSGDLDGDGRVDLYFPTGHTRDFNHSDYKAAVPTDRIGREDWDLFEERPELREPDLVFKNASDWQFEKTGAAWGLGQEKTMTYGAALSDLDRDGDLDLVTIQLEDPPALYQNQSAERGQAKHLLVNLKAKSGNQRGIGAKVILELTDGKHQTRTLMPTNGYQESDEPVVHFGLGAAETITSLRIEWPSGTKQQFSNLKPNRWLEIEESSPAAESLTSDNSRKTIDTPMFRPSAVFQTLTSPETEFDDFKRQPLLPHKHSQLGPGQAWGDADGDGRIDLYLGGPKGQAGRLLLNRGVDERGEPVFAMRMREPFTSMMKWEDMGVLLFEADGDGDLDLLCVSGGVECEPGDASLVDRLYLNDGTGMFSQLSDWESASDQQTPASGSVAAAADFDQDGDLDVFIGGRIVPGEYPVAATNRLLVNDGSGHFTNLAADFQMEKTGLVTSALWSDANGDGWIDLLITHEWGPVQLFTNQQGKLVNTTEAAGLAKATGFWNSLAGRDLDGDGDIDYLAGNLGLNTKYKATPERPELIYFGDFDGTGKKNLIEAKIDQDTGTLLPRRGLSCSSQAMPRIREKIGTFQTWASSSLQQLYSESRLSEALRLEATTLKSSILINDGEGHFEIRPLPALAQIAPVFGINLTDVDADGRTDAILAQNFFTNQQETGPFDGGLSLLLKGTEDGFTEIWPAASGIVLPGDAKSVGVVDLNNDARPDFVFGVNQGPPQVFLNQLNKTQTGEPIVINLIGPVENPTGVGARVTISVSGLPNQTAEITAGSGYLTQQSGTLFFGWGASADIQTADATIRWPDGRISSHKLVRTAGSRFTIEQK